MDERHLKKLLKKYVRGQCTAEESAKINAWFLMHKPRASESFSEEDASAQRARIRAYLETYTSPTPRIIPLSQRYISVAAMVLVFLSVSTFVYWWVHRSFGRNEPMELTTTLPGRDRAILTLSDGRRLDLEKENVGQLALQAGIQIVKSASGELIYTMLPTEGSAGATSQRNRIETPNGGQFQVRLPDGTNVWLNASSSLEFDVHPFPQTERRVILIGEAFFDVAHRENEPFVVLSEGQEVRVLGTQFNVTAYPDEPETRTTLVEGRVGVRSREGSTGETQEWVYLNPGEQAQRSADGNMTVVSAFAEDAAAWKDGYFVFDNESIEQIMRKVSRWYDVEVEFRDIRRDQQFSGSVSRFEDLTKVLEKLELTGGVHFKIESGFFSRNERRIIVMP